MPVQSKMPILAIPAHLQVKIINQMRYQSFIKFYRMAKYSKEFCDEHKNYIRVFPEHYESLDFWDYSSTLEISIRDDDVFFREKPPQISIRLSYTNIVNMISSPASLNANFAQLVINNELHFFVIKTIRFTEEQKFSGYDTLTAMCIDLLEQHRLRGVELCITDITFVPRLIEAVKPRSLYGPLLDPCESDALLMDKLSMLRLLELQTPNWDDMPVFFDSFMEKFEKLHGMLKMRCNHDPGVVACGCAPAHAAFYRLAERLVYANKSISIGIEDYRHPTQTCNVVNHNTIPDSLQHLNFQLFRFSTKPSFNPCFFSLQFLVEDTNRDLCIFSHIFYVALAPAEQKRYIVIMRLLSTHVVKAIDTWDEFVELLPLALNSRRAKYYYDESSLSPKLDDTCPVRALFP